MTKSEFAVFQERIENRLVQFQQSSQTLMDSRLTQTDSRLNQLENRMDSRFAETDRKMLEMEFRLVTRLGVLTVSAVTIAVMILTWLIKT